MKPVRSLSELAEERIVPQGNPMHFAWHLARYQFARPFVAAKRVLDAGSGEGYGAALLAADATEVLGLDYSPVAVEHARATYQRPNLRFAIGDLTAPRDTGEKFDVIVCFEVIEHLAEQEAVIDHFADQLLPDGTLLISTPNVLAMPFRDQFEYHVHELTLPELRSVLHRRFSRVDVRGQFPSDRMLRTVIKSMIPRSARVRFLTPTPDAQRRLHERLPSRRDDSVPPPAFRFSNRLADEALVMVAAARK